MEYRRSLAASFLFRFFVDVALRLEAEEPSFTLPLPPSFASAAARFERPPARGLQYFARAGQDAVVGAPHRHLAADIQARGRPYITLGLFAHCPLGRTPLWARRTAIANLAYLE